MCLVTLITMGTSSAFAATPKHVQPLRPVRISHTQGLSGKDMLALYRNSHRSTRNTISTSDQRTRLFAPMFTQKSHVVHH